MDGSDDDLIVAETARAARAIEAMRALRDAFDALVIDGEHIPADRLDVFAVVWGWCARVLRTSTLVEMAYREGLESEAAPLVRSMGEHAMCALWLADGGSAAYLAVIAARRRAQRALVEAARAAEWRSPALDDFALPALPPNSPTLHEFGNFEVISALYETAIPYVAYRLESSQTHATYDSSAGYVRDAGNGILDPEKFSHRAGHAAPVVAYAAAATAAMVLARELNDDAFDNAVAASFETYGEKFPLPSRRAAFRAASSGNDDLAARVAALVAVTSEALDEGSPLLDILRNDDAVSGVTDADRRELTRLIQRASSNLRNALDRLPSSRRQSASRAALVPFCARDVRS